MTSHISKMTPTPANETSARRPIISTCPSASVMKLRNVTSRKYVAHTPTADASTTAKRTESTGVARLADEGGSIDRI